MKNTFIPSVTTAIILALTAAPASGLYGQDYEPGKYAERGFSISKYPDGDSTINSRQMKKYAALRDATTLSVEHKDGNNFEITLSCSLDSSRCKDPLTLRIDGVTMWMRASQGSRRLEAKGGQGHWTVNVNPFRGPVSVVAPRYFPPVDTGIEPAFTVKLYTNGQTPGSAGAGDGKLGAIATPAAETCLVAGADPGESNGTTSPEYRRENGDLYNVGDDARFDVYLPSNPNGQMVVICPGGGYAYSATLNEGKYMAKMFVDRGIAAAVLHYRMPNGHYTVPLTDVQNAFRWCRAHASEWGVQQIGVLGGSAGGHLAASASTMFTDDVTRPDFSILFYPVITMDDRYTNGWTKSNLLGEKKTDATLCDKWSLENAVTGRTPRTFIVQCEDDGAVPMENALRYYCALRANKVQAEIHIYPHGGHGWGCNKGEYIGYGRDPFEYARPEFEASLFRWLEEMAKDFKPAQTAAEVRKIDFTSALYRTGDDSAWSASSIDESGWQTVSIAGNDNASSIKEENSYAWYRIHFAMNQRLDRDAIVFIHLGYIDDTDEAFLNGKPIGTTPSYNMPSVYGVSASDLNLNGDNVIAIRVRNNGGLGGVSDERQGWYPNGKYLEIISDAGAYIKGMMSEVSDWSRKSKTEISNLANYTRYAGDNESVLGAANDGHRVVLMGNSITDRWPEVRPDFFSANDLIGRGISGETSAQFLLRFHNDVIDLKPSLVVINYGTNDIAENTGAYSEEQTFTNVKAMCEMASACGIKVVLASTLPHGGFLWNPSIKDAMQKIRSLNSRVKAYADEAGITYIDYFSAMVSPDGTAMREDLSTDGVHPNGQGYAIMESIVLPVIQKLR